MAENSAKVKSNCESNCHSNTFHHFQTGSKGHEVVESSRHSDAPIEAQWVGGTTDGQQLFFRPHDDQGWLEIPFQAKENQTNELVLKMVHSSDYGIYRILLDGKPIAQFDLYNPDVITTTDKLGAQVLMAGAHILRFECIGKSAKPAGYYLGFDALAARFSAYSRSPKVDLRTLQKPMQSAN